MELSVRRKNFPENTFMKWLREKSPNNITLEVKQSLHSESRRYLSDFITLEDISSWSADTPIITNRP